MVIVGKDIELHGHLSKIVHAAETLRFASDNVQRGNQDRRDHRDDRNHDQKLHQRKRRQALRPPNRMSNTRTDQLASEPTPLRYLECTSLLSSVNYTVLSEAMQADRRLFTWD